MNKNLFLVWLFLSAMLLTPIGVSAQVTIGSSNPPSRMALLDLDASKQAKALHNARLTTEQRDSLVSEASSAEDQALAEGLLLYNITNDCLEFWNGSQWISLCTSLLPPPEYDYDGFRFIRGWNDLAAIANNLAGNFRLANTLNRNSPYYEMTAGGWDADGWMPLGTFDGTFDGNGFEILDLWINRPDSTNQGLFANVGNAGTIHSVHIGTTTAGIVGNSIVGGIVASNDGLIHNVRFSGAITGNWDNILPFVGVGGIVGINFQEGRIRDAINHGNIQGGRTVGGIVGNQASFYDMERVGNHGEITGVGTVPASNVEIGGIVGYWSTASNLRYSFNTGNVEGNSLVGGLVGSFDVGGIFIDQSFNQGNVSGISSVGGITGWTMTMAVVTNSYNIGNVSGGDGAGGIVGEHEGGMTNVFNTGNVTGSSEIGGLAGWIHASNNTAASYALNQITSASGSPAGRVGGSLNGSFMNVFARNNMTITANGVPVTFTPNANNIHGADISFVDATDVNAAAYIGNGWDFDTIWIRGYTPGTPGIGSTANLPILRVFLDRDLFPTVTQNPTMTP